MNSNTMATSSLIHLHQNFDNCRLKCFRVVLISSYAYTKDHPSKETLLRSFVLGSVTCIVCTNIDYLISMETLPYTHIYTQNTGPSMVVFVMYTQNTGPSMIVFVMYTQNTGPSMVVFGQIYLEHRSKHDCICDVYLEHRSKHGCIWADILRTQVQAWLYL